MIAGGEEQKGASLRVERDGNVAVIVVEHPPINPASREVRSGLLAAMEEAAASSEIAAIVLFELGSAFISGSELREFDQTLVDPQLPAVIAAIESCSKPVVAALHGEALGKGFELALGCDARVALAGAVVGLPEVTLGVIPGAGGTQRLPRLAGIPKAIALIGKGERLPAIEALSLGLIDRVAAVDLRSEAVALARAMQGRKKKVRDLLVPECGEAEIAASSASALRAGKNRPAVHAAIDSVLLARTLAFDAALAQERSTFQSLRMSREACALRYEFLAEREAARHPAFGTAPARPVKSIAIIGAGTMGSGIAIAALDSGFNVILLDQQDAALRKGVDRIHTHYSSRSKAGRIDTAQAIEREARLKPGIDWTMVSEADLAIEAVFEDLTIKQDVFRRLDQMMRPGAILASNTSYIDLDAIAAVTSRPQDVAGLHFFSPAHAMRLLEIVRGANTSPGTLSTCLQLARSLNKIPVVSANAFGFIGNRIYAAYRRQCEFMLEEGATPGQVDAALEAFGFAMGPFAVADLSGLDIAWRMRQSLAATRDANSRYVRIPDMLCEAGRLGQKTGAGYYSYESGRRWHDPKVDEILDRARAAKGIVPRLISEQEVVRRVLLAMVNEAALVLQEKIAERASDIDVVLVNGYGFPKWEGGPVFWARERGVENLEKDIEWLAGISGPGFIHGDVLQIFHPLQAA